VTRRQSVAHAARAHLAGTVLGRMVDLDGQVMMVHAVASAGDDGSVVWKSAVGVEVWRWGSVRFRVKVGEDVSGWWERVE
jgi:hypothetical protein